MRELKANNKTERERIAKFFDDVAGESDGRFRSINSDNFGNPGAWLELIRVDGSEGLLVRFDGRANPTTCVLTRGSTVGGSTLG